jgi:hypothetical protein
MRTDYDSLDAATAAPMTREQKYTVYATCTRGVYNTETYTLHLSMVRVAFSNTYDVENIHANTFSI